MSTRCSCSGITCCKRGLPIVPWQPPEYLSAREQILKPCKCNSLILCFYKIKEKLSLSLHHSKVPSKAIALDIERQQKIKQDLYLFLLQKREAAISAAATIMAPPVGGATTSGKPVKPNEKKYCNTGRILVPVGIITFGNAQR